MTNSAVPPSRAGVLGVDFGGTKIAAAIADLDGRILVRGTRSAQVDGSSMNAVGRGIELVETLLADTHSAGLEIVGAAAVAPGVHRSEHDPAGFSPNLPALDSATLASQLSAVTKVAAAPIWNDVHAAALAELRSGGLRGADPGLYLGLGTGIAAGICIGGEVIRGAHGAAGEIGYLSVGTGPSLGAAADVAQVEELVGGKALAERASVLLGEATSTAQLFERNDPASLQILHSSLGILASTVANLATTFDPSRIVLGGGLMRSGEVILEVVRAQVARQVPAPPQIAAAQYVHDASLHGAIALALDHRVPRRTPRTAIAGA